MFGKPKRPSPFNGPADKDPRFVVAGLIRISEQLDYIARLLEQQEAGK